MRTLLSKPTPRPSPTSFSTSTLWTGTRTTARPTRAEVSRRQRALKRAPRSFRDELVPLRNKVEHLFCIRRLGGCKVVPLGGDVIRNSVRKVRHGATSHGQVDRPRESPHQRAQG